METMNNRINITNSLVSEKLDGVCGIWDGRVLKTRSGNTLNAPKWWTCHLPDKPLAGELWTGRDEFERVLSIVRSNNAGSRWKAVRFGIFQGSPGITYGPYAFVIDQHPVRIRTELDAFYKDVLDKGGEGIVITTQQGEQYKQKPTQDNEGVLIEYVKGIAGKFDGLVSSFVLRLRDNRILRVSSGLDMATRKQPPAIGSVVRFTFKGLTGKGMPRHAAYVGLRAENRLEF